MNQQTSSHSNKIPPVSLAQHSDNFDLLCRSRHRLYVADVCLHYLASAFSSGSTDAIAIDVENNSISTYLKEEPPSLNSTITTDAVSGMVLSHVMEGLLRMSVDDKLEAGLAERWEVTPTHATFWLRENALWSDGQPITAADFIFPENRAAA